MSESGTHARVDHVDDMLDRVIIKLDRLDERVGDLRVDVAAMRGSLENLRQLVDGVHMRANKIEDANGRLEARVDTIERAQDEQRGEARRTKISAVGGAAGAGGAIAVVAEVIRALVGAS